MTTCEDRYAAAEALKNEGKLAEAVVALEGLVAEHPTFTLAHSALAAWCTRLERHDEAISRACVAAALPRRKTLWPDHGCCRGGTDILAH